MSIIAGIVSRHSETEISVQLRKDIARAISRHEWEVMQFCAPGMFLVKADLGSRPGKGFFDDSFGSVSLLAGHPFFQSSSSNDSGNRDLQLAVLHESWKRKSLTELKSCRGTFCAVFACSVEKRVWLISDHLGLRPIYAWIGKEYILFATALRILEALDSVPKSLDLRGVAETAAFGYPLADRTPYQDILTLRAGEVLEIYGERVNRLSYWRWDTLPTRSSTANMGQDIFGAFMASVQRRLTGATVAGFLSGGLDSRAIVAVLKRLDVHVVSLNFAQPGTQDREFGLRIAAALNTEHHEIPKTAGTVADTYNLREVYTFLDKHHSFASNRGSGKLVWSGDGGSMGLGHIYLNEEVIREMRNSKVRSAVTNFLSYNGWGFPTRILTKQLAETYRSVMVDGMTDELAQLDCEDPGRRVYLFLMLNDQRRHLMKYFEDIDLNGVEFELPFYDSDFLATVMSYPIDAFLRHRFYVDWLSHFQAEVSQVPWQAYPGHVPCPLPMPENLMYQWKQTYNRSTETAVRIALAERILREALNSNFPSGLLRRGVLLAAATLTRLGLEQYQYLLRTADVYLRYCKTSNGN